MVNQDPQPGQVLIQPRLNRRRTVVAGDTLRKLTKDNYGDHGAGRTPDLMMLVAAANHIADWNRIKVGQTVYFPSLD